MNIARWRLLIRHYSTSSPFDLNIETVQLLSQTFKSTGANENQPIIFLHGLCGNKKNNRTSSRILARDLHRDVHALDLRNHGESPHILRHDTPSMASDVERFIEERNLGKTIVIGHSMGAKVAYAIALRRPEMLSLVIAVDNIPAENIKLKLEFVHFKERLECLSQIEKSGCTKIADLDQMMTPVEPSSIVRAFILSNLHHNHHRLLESKIPTGTLIDSLDKIRGWEFGQDHQWAGPLLLIRALHSPFVDGYELYQKQFPQGDIEEVDASHWVISEKNKLFNKICVDFIKRKNL